MLLISVMAQAAPIPIIVPPPVAESAPAPLIYAPPAVPLFEPPSPAAIALPPPARKMLEAAIENGDAAAIASVAKLARKLYPDGVTQIDALVAEYEAKVAEAKANAARARAEALANAAFLDNWKGEVELGASRSTGNTDSTGIYGAVKLTKEGLRWRHQITSRADFQRTNGITTTDRFAGAWQPNYKVDDRFYAYGLGQYEHDRLLGYDTRITAGAGVGYSIVKRPGLRIGVEGGPAIRYTDFVTSDARTTVAGRASFNMKWNITPTLVFGQDAAVYLESRNNNAVATTTLDTKLIGALKARFSYNLTYERDAPTGRDSLDTTSRATLVYSF